MSSRPSRGLMSGSTARRNNNNNHHQQRIAAQKRHLRLLDAAQQNYDMTKDLLEGEYYVDEVVEYYSIPGTNVLALRLGTLAFVAVQLASVKFDKEKRSHQMLKDLHDTQNVNAVTHKYNITCRKLVLSLANTAYETITIAMANDIDEQAIVRVNAYFNGSIGKSVPGCLEKVRKEDNDAQVAFEQNLWEVYGTLPAHIFTHKGDDGRMW